MNKLSVLMSIYEDEYPEYFDKALQSVWGDQTLKPDEIVLVKDGCLTPELDEIIEKFQGKMGVRLKVVALPQNVGLGAALNLGLRYCTHELVARMDTDDIALPDRLEKQMKRFHLSPELDVLGSYSIEIDENGCLGNKRVMPMSHESIVASLWANPFIHSTVMFRRKRLLEVRGYAQSFRRRQDYELWFRCAAHGMNFANIPEPLILYRFNRRAHKKQTIELALEQALIGYRGTSMLNMAWWKRLACFIPFFRSFLPVWLQHFLYSGMKRFDPRRSGFEQCQ